VGDVGRARETFLAMMGGFRKKIGPEDQILFVRRETADG
jgi:hypothetical protein